MAWRRSRARHDSCGIAGHTTGYLTGLEFLHCSACHLSWQCASGEISFRYAIGSARSSAATMSPIFCSGIRHSGLAHTATGPAHQFEEGLGFSVISWR